VTNSVIYTRVPPALFYTERRRKITYYNEHITHDNGAQQGFIAHPRYVTPEVMFANSSNPTKLISIISTQPALYMYNRYYNWYGSYGDYYMDTYIVARGSETWNKRIKFTRNDLAYKVRDTSVISTDAICLVSSGGYTETTYTAEYTPTSYYQEVVIWPIGGHPVTYTPSNELFFNATNTSITEPPLLPNDRRPPSNNLHRKFGIVKIDTTIY